MKNAKDANEYTFVMHNEAHSKSMCKWIMYSQATKHMILFKDAFDTYEVIASRNVHLDSNSVVEAIIMGFIIVEAIVKGELNHILIKNALYVPKL